MSDWQTICEIDDLTANTGVCALVEDKQVAVFAIGQDKQLFAIQNFDPVGKANVLSRGIVGDIDGEVVVASPLYKQQYALTDGKCIDDAELSVETYPIRLSEAGQVQVNV